MDDRVEFANEVCKILYAKNHGNLDKCLGEIQPIYNGFFAHVRNIYECVEKHIPMFFLYELKKYGRKNGDWTEVEFNKLVELATNQCHKILGE
jgi:hypothetical protein